MCRKAHREHDEKQGFCIILITILGIAMILTYVCTHWRTTEARAAHERQMRAVDQVTYCRHHQL